MKWLLLLVIPLSVQAKQSRPPQVTVWSRGNASAVRAFVPPQSTLLDRDAEAKELRESGYLEPRQRDALFRKLGLESPLKKLDEFDKDMLVMSAPHYTVAQLKKQYPMLSEKQLASLKREIRKIK